MTRVFTIEGMHCSGCLARVRKAVSALAPGAEVTLAPPRLTLPEGASLELAALNAALAAAGGYKAAAAAG